MSDVSSRRSPTIVLSVSVLKTFIKWTGHLFGFWLKSLAFVCLKNSVVFLHSVNVLGIVCWLKIQITITNSCFIAIQYCVLWSKTSLSENVQIYVLYMFRYVYGEHPQNGTHHQMGYIFSDVGVPILPSLYSIGEAKTIGSHPKCKQTNKQTVWVEFWSTLTLSLVFCWCNF